MDPNLELRRKWTFRAHGQQMIFIKKTMESSMHVWTKALIWALFLTDYPDLSVEPSMELRYKPDLVQQRKNIIQTRLVASDAGVDLIGTVFSRLFDEICIRKKRPGHGDHVGISTS